MTPSHHYCLGWVVEVFVILASKVVAVVAEFPSGWNFTFTIPTVIHVYIVTCEKEKSTVLLWTNALVALGEDSRRTPDYGDNLGNLCPRMTVNNGEEALHDEVL